MSEISYLADLSGPKPLPEPPSFEDAICAIKDNNKKEDEARQYSAAARKLNELATSLNNAARRYPYGIMRALGYIPGRVMQQRSTGRLGVVVAVYDGGPSARIQYLTTDNYVSSSSSLEANISPKHYDHWEWIGQTIEPHPKSTYWPYYGQLVPADKRVKAN